jgi:hypothetical protein
MRTTTTLFVGMLSVSAFAQATSYQIALAPPGNNLDFQYADAALFADGSVAYLARTEPWSMADPAFLVTKFDAGGGILWSRNVSQTAEYMLTNTARVLAMPDGGIAVFGGGSIDSNATGGYGLTRFQSDGTLAWAKHYAPVSPLDMDYGYSAAEPLPDGGIMLNIGLMVHPTFVRLDGDGDISWARSFITDDPDTNKVPTFGFGLTSDGGMLVTEKANTDMMLVRVDASGQAVWSHRYSTYIYTHTKDALQLANGDLLVCGYNDMPFAARLDPDGNVIWMRGYGNSDIYDGFQRLFELPNGDLLFSPSALHEWETATVLLRTDASGTPIDLMSLNGDLLPGKMELIGMSTGQLVLGGEAIAPVGGGFESFHQLWRVDPVDLPCGVEFQSGSTVFFEDQADMVTMSDGCNVTDRIVNVSSANLPVTPAIYTAQDLCALITGMEEMGTRHAPTVYPSPIGAGVALTVQADPGTSVQLLSYDGRLLMQAVLRSNSVQLGTTGLSPGMYLIRLADANGVPLHEERIVVE